MRYFLAVCDPHTVYTFDGWLLQIQEPIFFDEHQHTQAYGRDCR